MRSPLASKIMTLAVAAVFADAANGQAALPTGFSVAAGAGTVEQSGSAMTVRQTTPRAVYNWDTFSVGNSASLEFVQPGVSAIAANRIAASGGQSVIDGILRGNGNVLILNPNGVLFGSNASVSVAGLVASTGDLRRDSGGNFAEFMAGGTFGIAGATSGAVSNSGTITINDSGLAAFVAPSVANAGTIVATTGRITLASGQQATLSLNGGLYEIAVAKGVDQSTASVANPSVGNTGTLKTREANDAPAGGSIVLSATDLANAVSGVINVAGIQQADRIEVDGGHVVLKSHLDATAVTGASTTIDVCHCGRIQDGIDIAASGATVNVSAGTYEEQLHITKSVVLAGAGVGQTLVTPGSLSADTDGMLNILTIGGATTSAEVSGFTFAGPVAGITSGVFVRDGAHANIHDNRVSDIREGVAISGNQTGIGIFVGRAKIGTSASADIENNVITGYQKGGIVVDGPGSSATISGNTISGEGPTPAIAQNGIQVSRGASATVEGNAVSGNAYTGHSADPDDFAAGILFFNSDPYVGQGGLAMGTANRVSGNEVGVWTNDPIVLSTVTLSGVTGNTRNAVAYFNGGYAGQGPFLEYPAWSAASAAFVDSSAFSGAQTGDIGGAGGGLRVYGWNGFAAIQPAIDAVASGGMVNVGAGTYVQSATLNVTKSVTLAGAGESQAAIDARGVSGYGILVNADNVALSDLTVYGPTATAAFSYGIKVQPAGSAPTSRLHDFSITRVTTRGAFKAELDLNGVLGATIDHVTADGTPYGAAGGTTGGAGIQITDSANVTISNSTTRNNAWGGVALYQSNRFYDQQTTGISVQGNNTLTEANPLYLQDESSTRDFGSVTLSGFAYGVRNRSTTNDNFQYTWMQPSSQGAFDLAVNLPSSADSTVQSWNGTALTQSFHVGVGHTTTGAAQAMSIMAAVDTADPGATVNVYPGSYLETAANRFIPGVGDGYTLGLFLYKDGMTLRGVDAAGSAISSADGVQAWIRSGAITNFGMAHGIVANDVTIEGLGFKPYSGSLNKTIEIQADNFTFRNSVVDNRYQPGPDGTPAGGAGALYFGENDPAGHQIARLTVTGSKFYDGSVTLTNGVGVAVDDVTYQPAADRVISNNTFIGSSNYSFGGLLMNGKMSEIPWRLHPIGGASVSGNRFSGFDESVLVRGDQAGIDLAQVMRDDSFDHAVLVTDTAGNARGEIYQSTPDGVHFTPRLKYSIQSSVQAGVDRAADGDSIAVGQGSYAENVVLAGQRDLVFDHATLLGMTANGSGTGIGGNATATGARGFVFNAPVTLLGDTSLTTAGANIAFNGDIQNAGPGRYALTVSAGTGDVLLTSGGSAANPLGMLTIGSNNFRLTGTLWVSGYDIDALGAVALSDHTLRQVGGGAANTIDAGGGVSGSTISEGDVAIRSSGTVAAHVTATTVVIAAPSVDVTVNAASAVRIHSEAPANVAGSAPSVVLDAPGGAVAGSFGQVTNVGTGIVTVNGKPQANAAISASAENNRVVPQEGMLTSAGAAAPAASGESDEERRRRRTPIARSSVTGAGDLLQRGIGVELDLAPSLK